MHSAPEFTSRALVRCAYLSGGELDYGWSGKPTDDAVIESFSRTLRAECLNEKGTLRSTFSEYDWVDPQNSIGVIHQRAGRTC